MKIVIDMIFLWVVLESAILNWWPCLIRSICLLIHLPYVMISDKWYALVIANHLPTQNLLSDAKVTICKYKYLIISTNTFILGYLKWLRGTVGGRKIGKKLQILLPSKKENANICKIDFPVLCTFTLFNADFCTFL